MHRGMSKLHDLKVRRHTARFIDLNQYLALLPGSTFTDKIGVTELNEILLNSMPNRWIRQAYVQGFEYENILFKESVKMFERMLITESIYEGVVEISC